MIDRVDHLGIAVRSIRERLGFWRDALGLEVEATEEVATEKVRTAFLPVGEIHVELLEPTAPDSPIARFLERRGEGLHHVCFRARSREDVDALHALLLEMGAHVVHPPEEAGFAPGYYSVLFEDPEGIRLEMNFVPGRGHLDRLEGESPG